MKKWALRHCLQEYKAYLNRVRRIWIYSTCFFGPWLLKMKLCCQNDNVNKFGENKCILVISCGGAIFEAFGTVSLVAWHDSFESRLRLSNTTYSVHIHLEKSTHRCSQVRSIKNPVTENIDFRYSWKLIKTIAVLDRFWSVRIVPRPKVSPLAFLTVLI